MGEGKLTPLTTLTPLNRQLPNIAYVITSTISPHMPHLVKIARGVTSLQIAKVTTHFLFVCMFHPLEVFPPSVDVSPLDRPLTVHLQRLLANLLLRLYAIDMYF